jgi:hypothetical protein
MKNGSTDEVWGADIGVVVVLLVLSVAIYWFVPGYGLIETWDDSLYVLDRPVLRDWWAATWSEVLTTPRLGYPVPVPTAIYAAAGSWTTEAGLGPTLHTLQVGLHLVNVGLAYLLARRWLTTRVAAGVAAAVWASHPLLVESVASATYLKTVLLGTSVLGAGLCWDRLLADGSSGWAIGATAVGLAGLGCRPEAVMIGPMLVAQTWLADRSIDWRDARIWGPLAILAAAGAVYLPIAFFGHREAVESVSNESIYEIDWEAFVIRIGALFGTQLEHVVWPIGLQPGYFPGGEQRRMMAVVGYGAMLVGLVGSVAAWRRGGGLGGGVAMFWLFYLPVSGLEVVPRFAADAYMYLPLAGLAIIVGSGAERVLSSDRRLVRATACALVGATVVGLAAVSHVQTWRWESTPALWEPVIEQYSDARFPKLQIGHYFVQREQYGKARRIYERVAGDLPPEEKPIELAGAYARFGEGQRAVELAFEILGNRGRVELESWQFLIQTAVMYEVDVPDAERPRRLMERAARESLGYLRRREGTETLVATANYLVGQGFGEVGKQYLEAAVEVGSGVCGRLEERIEDAELLEYGQGVCRE